jgi:hypothetical protein
MIHDNDQDSVPDMPIVREVVSASYLPGRLRYDPRDREKLKARLVLFESELPPELKLSQALEHGTMYFAGIVNITYKFVIGPAC